MEKRIGLNKVVVKKGENLKQLSRRYYGVEEKSEKIATLNGLASDWIAEEDCEIMVDFTEHPFVGAFIQRFRKNDKK